MLELFTHMIAKVAILETSAKAISYYQSENLLWILIGTVIAYLVIFMGKFWIF